MCSFAPINDKSVDKHLLHIFYGTKHCDRLGLGFAELKEKKRLDFFSPTLEKFTIYLGRQDSYTL